ncbi:MAG: DEAD/DEAH box helicase family protein [Terriglobia bacterium]
MLKPGALEPLFEPWEEPNLHRVKNPIPGAPALVRKKRRPSPITVVQNLRGEVRQWREAFYVGASDTTRELLGHWFDRPHRMTTPSGDEFAFRYYFCQREAIETLIYLKEVRRIETLSQIINEFGGREAEIAALGITEEEDAWSRYAFKIATGAGKTKCMSLAMVWSYFHALRESGSEMARHFVIIAPNLTVYERLKEDFGDGKIFDTDPLIPPEWKGDWNMSIVLQDEASGAATGGTLYLTNIHRLYDTAKRKRKSETETYDFMGPPVSKSTALDTGAALRDRVTAHNRVLVLNDEAHHVWDPDSAWNEAVQYLHNAIRSRTGGGIIAQLDFSATPKDNKGQPFKHIVCDTPLGEAVDGGIVKTPIIGRAQQDLSEEPSDDAAHRYGRHLQLGYERWKKSCREWEKSGKKALLFIMCEDTDAADQITRRLNTDSAFADLNGKTINLHTNLKGKIKKVGSGPHARLEFVENDKEISDEDLKALRELSRNLDHNSSPYHCIVSVLMLREGWDVRNVTTIVPLRAYTSKAAILPEQTLGRGLRRMTPPGSQGASETVTVVEHPAFASLYQEQLAQEGLPLEITDVDKVPTTTVSIYPDEARKDFKALQIGLPTVTAGYRIVPTVENLTIEDVKDEFRKYQPLPLGERGSSDIDYEGRHLMTGEVVERMKIHLPLLESGFGAISYFVQQLEQICKVRGLHTAIAPLLQTFLQEILFREKTTLSDPRLIARLGNTDVVEHVRAVFVPLILKRITKSEQRTRDGAPALLSEWKPFQVTHSERRRALEAKKTLFNLVPCNRELETAFTGFADRASDIVSFAKNAGPQSLRIDYLSLGGRLSFYTPDFFVRTQGNRHYLVETKGREDRDVPLKARAAIEWCKTSSTQACKWEYVYIPQGIFERLRSSTMQQLADACRPALQNLLDTDTTAEQGSLFGPQWAAEDEARSETTALIPKETLDALPSRYQQAVQQAAMLYAFLENKEGINFAAVFTGLLGSLDEAAKGLISRRLTHLVPVDIHSQRAWFDVHFPYEIEQGKQGYLQRMAQNLKKTLVFESGISPIGLLRSCLDFALNDHTRLPGVFTAIREQFRFQGARKLLHTINRINDFRNTWVAHQEQELTDSRLAKMELIVWVDGIWLFSTTE